MILTVRPATPDDLAAVRQLEGVVPATARMLSAELRSPTRRALVAAAGADEVVGLVVTTRGGPEVDLLDLAVAPRWRRHGVGRQLVRSAAGEALAGGAGAMLLEVRPSNAPALALYAGMGFTEVGRRDAYYADGEAALVLAHRDLAILAGLG